MTEAQHKVTEFEAVTCSCCALQTQAELDKAVVECNAFALASHQYWGVWAVLQAAVSPIDFDYMKYVDLRWSEYHRRKQEFLSDLKQWCKTNLNE